MRAAFEEGLSQKNNTAPSIFCVDMERARPISGILPHYHDYIEILYALDCDLNIWINDEEISFSSGELVIINSRETHEVYAKRVNNGRYRVIKFSPEILRFDGQGAEELKYLLPLFGDDFSRRRKLSAKKAAEFSVKSIIDEIFDEWQADDFGCEIALRGAVLSLFSKVVRAWKEFDGDSPFLQRDETTRTIYSAAEFCAKHFATVTESEIAGICAMSYSYFARTFRRVMQKTFTNYINDLKIDHARKLLLTTSLPITEVAQECGFSTASHFISIFKAKTGFSPLAYRRNLVGERLSSL